MVEFIKNIPSEFYWIFIFFSTFTENIFPPYPGDTVVVFGGYLSGIDKLGLPSLIASVILGNLLSATLMYFFGEKVIAFFKKHSKSENIQKLSSEESLGKAKKWFEKYGVLAVILSRFSAAIRYFIIIIAGISKMNLALFLFLFTIATMIWNGILITAGYTLGRNWETVLYYLQIYNWFIGILILGGIIYFYWRQKKRSMDEVEKNIQH